MKPKKWIAAIMLAASVTLSSMGTAVMLSAEPEEEFSAQEDACFSDNGDSETATGEYEDQTVEVPSGTMAEGDSDEKTDEMPEIEVSETEMPESFSAEETENTETSENNEYEDQTAEDPMEECSCLCTADAAYAHDWECPLFWSRFMDECDCGGPQREITAHAFECTAFQAAMYQACTCGTEGSGMHDECEVIRLLHRELCDCTEEYSSVQAVLENHNENSRICKYLMEWAEFSNQAELLWTNSDAAGDSGRSPKIYKVGTTTVEDKNYAFVAKFGGAPTIYNSSNIPTYTNSKYSASGVHFKASGFKDGKSVYAVYPNVGKYDGKMLDLKLTLSDPLRTYTGHSTYTVPTVGFFKNKIGICQYVTHDVGVKFEFLQHGTNNVVAVKGHITIKDIDGGYQNYGSGFRAYENHGIDKINILNGGDHLVTSYKKSSAGNYYSLIKGKNCNDQGSTDLDESDKKGWAVIYFNGTFSIRTELGDDFDADSGHGNRHAGVIFESTAIGVYTPEAPRKRSGLKGTAYANMQWHSSTDNTKAERERPLETEPGGIYAYGIEHTIYPMTYTTYLLTDNLDSCMEYVADSGKILDSAGNDLTAKFVFDYQASSHVLSVKPRDFSVLDYKTTLYYTFHVKLADRETILRHGHEKEALYYIKNTASVNVNGTTLNTGNTWFQGKTDIPTGNITVTKKIKDADIIWAHGNPTFFFTISGRDQNGIMHTYQDFVEYRNRNYETAGEYAVMSVTFENIPIGSYAVGEEKTLRYEYRDIGENSSNVIISRESGTAAITLTEQQLEASVTYWNEKTRFDGLSHCDVVKNTAAIQWQ